MFNEASCIALHGAFVRWLARKYDLQGIDDDGLGVYGRPPEDWDDGDLDCIEAWEFWRNSGAKRTNDDLEIWFKIAESRRVDLSQTLHMTDKDKKQRKSAIAIAAVGAVAVGWWLFAPSKVEEELTNDQIADKLANIFDGVLTRRPEQHRQKFDPLPLPPPTQSEGG